MTLALNIKNDQKDLTQMAQQMAHDIRSPLSALNILTRSSQIQMSQEAKALMISAIQRINDIANNLLSLQMNSDSKLSPSTSTLIEPLEKKSECLKNLVQEIVNEKNLKFQNNNKIHFETNFKNALVSFCMVNKCELQRVLSNILENAAESITHSHGRIIISAENKHDHFQLTIEDNGKGIPQHILTKVGTRGFSYGKNKTESGNGLGVAHAISVIEAHCGTFKISSTLGVGTKVVIQLPL